VSFRNEAVGGVLTRRGKGTNSAQKNQLLFNRFGINYNDVPERMRKGSVILREVGYSPPLAFFLADSER
jgi:tRNA(His) 5'-end guanylyltransferase